MTTTKTVYWAVYRVQRNGTEVFVPRTVTTSEKLAKEIAKDFSEGRVIRPDGSEARVTPKPHIAKPIAADSV